MSYYDVTEHMKSVAQGTGLITTVTTGAFADIDIKRQTLFPLLHIVPVNFVRNESVISRTFTLYFCDLVDWNKEDIQKDNNPWWGNDNTIDVLNQMELAAQQFIDEIQRGDSYELNFQISIGNTGSYFTNKVENLLTGVQIELTIQAPSSSVENGIC